MYFSCVMLPDENISCCFLAFISRLVRVENILESSIRCFLFGVLQFTGTEHAVKKNTTRNV